MRSRRQGIIRTAFAALAVPSFLLAAGCADERVVTPEAESPAEEDDAFTGLGLVEVTVSGLGTETPTASAEPYAPDSNLASHGSTGVDGGLQPQSLNAPDNSGGGGDGTIQLEPFSTGSFTDGERGAGGVRYLYATFRVRNAQSDSTAYDTPRRNLTFLAVDTDGTFGVTPVSQLRLFDGTAVTDPTATTIAEGMLPTGAVYRNSPIDIQSSYPDVLQILTETEAGAVDLTGTDATDVFPYGFVVRNPNDAASRTLPASPGADQFDGVVTFAFKVPLQGVAAADPFEISMVFLPVDDDETRVTQPLEEQTTAALTAFEDRANALGAARATVLPGTRYTGRIPSRVLCRPVRIAGPEGGATTTLFPEPSTVVSLSPDPYATDGSGSFIASPAAFEATFDAAVTGVDATSFVVNGGQTGRRFLGPGQDYTGDGTTTIATPSGSFFAGETVEVALTAALGICPRHVARYRVATGAGSGSFATSATLTSVDAGDVALADLDGDGNLDMINSSRTGDSVAVRIGDGAGGFGAAADISRFASGTGPIAVAAGDLDGDGALDLAVANGGSDDVSVLLGSGTGGFAAATHFPAGDQPSDIALGDFNGDGALDAAVANVLGQDVSVLLGDGSGGFTLAADVAIGAKDPRSIALGDLDADGLLDIATANRTTDDVSVVIQQTGGTGWDAPATFAVGDAPLAVGAGDIDGDGALDLASCDGAGDETSTSTVSVLLNQ